MEFDLEQFAAHLDKLEDELREKPSLRHIIDADSEHNLSALRLMGILPRESSAGCRGAGRYRENIPPRWHATRCGKKGNGW